MRILLLIGILLAPFTGAGQTMRFSHLDQKQGLSQNTVNAFLQDRDGFIWVGTQDGLNRYDGYDFRVFRKTATDTNSLCDNFVLCLAEDSIGNIWIGTRNGLCVYAKSTGLFYRYYPPQENRSGFHNSVRQLSALKDSSIVYRTLKGYIMQVKFTLHPTRPEFTASTLSDSTTSFNYCASTNEIAELIKDNLEVHPIGGKGTVSYTRQPSSRMAPVLLLTEEYVFISDSLQLLVVPLHTSGMSRIVYTSDAVITALALDAGGDLWVGTTDGLRIIHDPYRTARTSIVREDQLDYFSLLGSRVETIFLSRDNMMWIGTVGGINIYDPLQTRFSVLRGILADRTPDSVVWFVMSFGDITIWSDDNGFSYTHRRSFAPAWLTALPQTVNYSAGCFDTKGRLWLGTKKQGFVIVDTAANTIERRFLLHPDFLEAAMLDMCVHKGKIWIASVGSLCTIDEDSYETHFLARMRMHPYGITTSYFSALQPDEKGNIYVASANGLFRFENGDTIYRTWKNDPASENSLAYNIINDIFLQDGKLWIATMGSGLDCYDVAQDKFTHYTTQQGLANNTIYGIEPGGAGQLWLSTNEGLIVLNTATGSARNFTMRDGLPSNEFVLNKHWRNSHDGSLYFGSSKGLVKFRPEEFELQLPDAKPVITRLQVNYADVPLPAGHVLNLSSSERNLDFEFSAIDFRNQDKISYAYRLEGFDTTWRPVEAGNRLAVFTNLPYGRYTFLVRYRVSGEPWSANVLRLDILIRTPFYATWWFRIVLALSGLAVTALIVRYISQRKLRRQLAELKVQEQMRNEKERISRDLHDNVGAQLTYVISSLDHLSYTLNRNAGAEKESLKLEQLGEYTRGTMNQLRESIWAINSGQISLSELAGKWKQYLAQLSETNEKFAGKIIREGEDEILKPTIAIEVHRIVQEAITNAFKHSGGDRVEIVLSRTDQTVHISVRDNGSGVPEHASKPGHYGLQNMRERAALINAHLTFSAANPGTTIVLEWNIN